LSYSQHLIRYELSFALFLVVKQSSPDNVAHKKSADKEKSTKKSHRKTKSTSAQSGTTDSALAEHSEDLTKKKQQRSGQKDHSATRSKAKSKETILEGKMEQEQVSFDADTKKSTRPENEVVTYAELDFALKEIPPQDNNVLIGPLRLTRFEKARITGARSLQLSLGAPSFISVSPDIRDSISLAIAEIDSRALPISIRRILPNGLYQDIPIDWMKL
jgi:DNA-directed RNA polymerase I, II, and III subunit RPABC2